MGQQLPSNMNAIVINKFGGPDVFEPTELPVPSPSADEVLINVRASSVNPVDWKIRSGFAPFLCPQFPAVLHPDCAGTIVAKGEGVTELELGDEVYCFASGLVGRPGALAEYMCADARMVAKKPKNLTFEQAATLPLVAVTSWICLLQRLSIRQDIPILIQGGTGGVGFFALQLAKAKLSQHVYATCGSDEKCKVAEGLGAVQAFNYRTTPVEDMVADATNGEGFGVVFNTPGQASINASVEAAAFGGSILDINGTFPTEGNFQTKQLIFASVFGGYPITHGFDQKLVGDILRETSSLVEDGRIVPLLDPAHFTFEQVGDAHAHQQNGAPTGKVALTSPWSH